MFHISLTGELFPFQLDSSNNGGNAETSILLQILLQSFVFITFSIGRQNDEIIPNGALVLPNFRFRILLVIGFEEQIECLEERILD